MAERYFGIDFGGSNLRICGVNPETGGLLGTAFRMSLEEVVDNKKISFIPIWIFLFTWKDKIKWIKYI